MVAVKSRANKWNWNRVENIYFVVALILGSLFAILTPPFQVTDENLHFYRANLIAEGTLIKTEGRIIRSIQTFNSEIEALDLPHKPENKVDPAVLIHGFFMPLEKKAKVVASSPTTLNYNPIMYLPQVIGVLIGKTLDLSPFKMLLVSRFINLIFGVLLTTLAIKICPFRKWSLLYLSLLPMTLSLYGSASADTFTISVSIFYISLILYFKQNGVSHRSIKWLILSTILLPFLKPGYVFLSLLVFIVPVLPAKKVFDMAAKVGVFSAAIGIFLIWFKVSSSFGPATNSALPGVDAAGQLAFILANPFDFLRIFITDLFTDLAGSVVTFIGVFGWLDAVMPFGIYVIYELCLGFILLFDNHYPIRSIKDSRFLLIATFLITFTILYGIFYFIYTPVGADFIQGFQGRYILPIASLIFFAFYNNRKKFQFNKIYLFLPTWVIGGIISLLTILARYYG